MKLLLDTHTLIWLADGDPKLSPTAAGLLADPGNKLFLSAATEWEMAIKSGMKKLTLDGGYRSFVTDAVAAYRLTRVSIDFEDCVAYETLPFPLSRHNDPSDRMLVTQALRSNFDVVGADVSFDAYGVTRHW